MPRSETRDQATVGPEAGYGILWAIRAESANLLVTVVCTLCLSEPHDLHLEQFKFLVRPPTAPPPLGRVSGALAHPHSRHGHRHHSHGVLVCESARRGVLAVPRLKLEVSLRRHQHFWRCLPDLHRDEGEAGAAQPRTATDHRLRYRGTPSSRGGARTRSLRARWTPRTKRRSRKTKALHLLRLSL